MGQLLRSLGLTPGEQPCRHVYVNLEDIEPTADETEIYKKTLPIIEKIESTVEMMRSYGGASEYIRKVIANPTDQELLNETWNALNLQLEKIKIFIDFSDEIRGIFPLLLKRLCHSSDFVETITTNPSTTKHFAQILDFCFRFDEIKAATPSLQNDLSFYRRQLAHQKSSMPDEELIISRDHANKITLFFASPTPFFVSITQIVNECFTPEESPSRRNAIDCFSTMIKLCRYMLEDRELRCKFRDIETQLLVLRYMVGLIILYDHVSETGAFIKSNTGFDVKQCIKVLKDSKNFDTTSLINAIKYTSKHLHDESTSRSIRDMLGC